MTREEAIEAIKNNYPDRKYSILREALNMAIEALQRKSINCNYTCSDCVHLNKSYEEEPCHSCFNNDGAGYEPVKHGKPSKEAELFIDEANAYKREKGERR